MNEAEEKKEKPFEEILRRLETNVAALESGDVPLEEALRLFEEGIRLSKVLTGRLAEAEESVRKLVKAGQGESKLENFEVDRDGG